MNPLDPSHLRIAVVDARLRRVRPLADFTELQVKARDNARGTGTVTVSTEHPALSALQADGSGVVVSWMGKTLISGSVLEQDADGLPGGLVPFEITDDWSLFDTPAWVRPGNPLGAADLDDLAQAWQSANLVKATVQGQVGYYAWPTATMPAETAAKKLIVENLVSRMGLEVRVEPDRGRGRVVAIPEVRFGSIAEALEMILFNAGGSLRVFQNAGEEFARVEWREPRLFPSPIDPALGQLAELKYTRTSGATRVVVGGNGSDAGRIFAETRDDTGLESRSRWPREIFETTNDIDLTWPEDLDDDQKVPKYFWHTAGVTQAQRDAATAVLRRTGEQALADNAATLSISAKLTTNERFYFGPGGFELGDRLNVRIAGVNVEERIAEVEFNVDENGIEITPTLGENEAPERRLAKQLQALRRNQSRDKRK